MKIYGIDFPDDEFDIMTIKGQPEVIVNAKGARRLAANAPDKEKGAEFLRVLDERFPGKGFGQG